MTNAKFFDVIGPITENTDANFSKFVEEILTTTSPTTPIIITINSNGGSVNCGLSIYNKIRALDNPVYILITGACCSIATIIAVSVPFENRFAFPGTRFLLHPVRTSHIDPADAKELEDLIKVSKINDNTISKIIFLQTEIGSEKLKYIFDECNEFSITSESFNEYGICKVIEKFSEVFQICNAD